MKCVNMSIGLDEIVINKRSGVLHTKNCEAVKQMKEANKQLSKVTNMKEVEKSQPCGHCLRKRDLKRLYTAEYERKKRVIEQRRERDHKRIDEKYDSRLKIIEQNYLENIEGLD